MAILAMMTAYTTAVLQSQPPSQHACLTFSVEYLSCDTEEKEGRGGGGYCSVHKRQFL